ncbi:MAG: hypothetical protein IKU68_03555 [Oscillospiraceae bacterium]|nr:hypothetical protein [Oscillospiraceae bacterium]
MKKSWIPALVLCFLLTGCRSSNAAAETAETISSAAATEQTVSITKIYPLPDSTMDNLSDAILSVSLEEGDAYVDDTGKMQMDLKIYTYDKYDMVDISVLRVGDILVTHAGEVEITSLTRTENGTVLVNGGLDENGIDLITDETGVFYERGYSDVKNWYEIGESTIRVSTDFVYHDTSDLDMGEILYYPGSFLIGEVTDYHFTPGNTTIRVENGQIMEMHRIYTP